MIAIGTDVPSQRAVSSRLQPPASSLCQTGGSVVFVQMDQQTIADYPVGGAIAERYAYTAYGQPTILNASGLPLTPQSSTLSNRYTYTGREWDATLGLHHFRARWMSGLTGRFLTRDPIGYRGGNDLYEYVRSRPLDRTDPSGHKDIRPWTDPPGIPLTIQTPLRFSDVN